MIQPYIYIVSKPPIIVIVVKGFSNWRTAWLDKAATAYSFLTKLIDFARDQTRTACLDALP